MTVLINQSLSNIFHLSIVKYKIWTSESFYGEGRQGESLMIYVLHHMKLSYSFRFTFVVCSDPLLTDKLILLFDGFS